MDATGTHRTNRVMGVCRCKRAACHAGRPLPLPLLEQRVPWTACRCLATTPAIPWCRRLRADAAEGGTYSHASSLTDMLSGG